mmetsp:Transcript_56135/g.99906  ORF Transcript_56135/g.99906 Transcript_56135/m.99906 type:complete len:312 (-) Transcript_56135:749-1684(-)
MVSNKICTSLAAFYCCCHQKRSLHKGFIQRLVFPDSHCQAPPLAPKEVAREGGGSCTLIPSGKSNQGAWDLPCGLKIASALRLGFGGRGRGQHPVSAHGTHDAHYVYNRVAGGQALRPCMPPDPMPPQWERALKGSGQGGCRAGRGWGATIRHGGARVGTTGPTGPSHAVSGYPKPAIGTTIAAPPSSTRRGMLPGYYIRAPGLPLTARSDGQGMGTCSLTGGTGPCTNYGEARALPCCGTSTCHRCFLGTLLDHSGAEQSRVLDCTLLPQGNGCLQRFASAEAKGDARCERVSAADRVDRGDALHAQLLD